MQLVPFGGGKYQPAPQVFGSVTSEPEFSLGRNHFLTLEFTAPSAQRASMVVKFWPIIKNGEPLQSHVVGGGPIERIYEQTLLALRPAHRDWQNKARKETTAERKRTNQDQAHEG